MALDGHYTRLFLLECKNQSSIRPSCFVQNIMSGDMWISVWSLICSKYRFKIRTHLLYLMTSLGIKLSLIPEHSSYMSISIGNMKLTLKLTIDYFGTDLTISYWKKSLLLILQARRYLYLGIFKGSSCSTSQLCNIWNFDSITFWSHYSLL